LEERQVVSRDTSLKGKTREEMGLEPFKGLEIRSAAMSIPITITEEVIAKACRVDPEGRFQWKVSKKDVLLESFTNLLLKGNPDAKYVDMEDNHRMLLKFITDCFFQRGGGSDQPNLDPKLVLYFLVAFQKINLPRYLMHHLCWAIKEGINKNRKQVPYGRLLSEIFYQGKLLEILGRFKPVSDSCFKITTSEKIINSRTLFYMNIIKEVSLDEKGLEKSTAETELMVDFPSISKDNNPEVLAGCIVAHARESNVNIEDENVPDAPEGIKGKRTRINTEFEAAGAKAKKQRVAKSEATKHDSASVSTPKRRRGKGDTLVTKEEVKLALEEMEAEEQKPRKRKQAPEQIVTPMFVVTPAMAIMVKEHAEN
jgi:hypothetical protein